MKNLIFNTTLFISLAITTGCVTQPMAPSEDKIPVVTQTKNVFSVPLNIGKLFLSEKTIYKKSALGVAYDYDGEMALVPNVYIYPLASTYPTVMLGEDEIDGYVAGFIDELSSSLKTGIYNSITINEISEEMYTSNQYGIILVTKITLFLERHNKPLNSTAYLTEIAGHVIKIRISYTEYPKLQENMDWFAENFIRGVYVVTLKDDSEIVLLPSLPEDRENFDFQAYLRKAQLPSEVRKIRDEVLKKSRINCQEPKKDYVSSVICYKDFDISEPILPFEE